MRFAVISAVALASTFVGVLSAPTALPVENALSMPVEDASIEDRSVKAATALSIVVGLDLGLKAPLDAIRTAAESITAKSTAAEKKIAKAAIKTGVTAATKLVKTATSALADVTAIVDSVDLQTILTDVVMILGTVNTIATMLVTSLGSAVATTLLEPLVDALNEFITTLGGVVTGFLPDLTSLVGTVLGGLNTILGGITL